MEIQPCGNNAFMIDSPKHPDINSVEDIQDINRRIVRLGEQFNKPVVATCDVHFLDPEDEVYRRIIMALTMQTTRRRCTCAPRRKC